MAAWTLPPYPRVFGYQEATPETVWLACRRSHNPVRQRLPDTDLAGRARKARAAVERSVGSGAATRPDPMAAVGIAASGPIELESESGVGSRRGLTVGGLSGGDTVTGTNCRSARSELIGWPPATGWTKPNCPTIGMLPAAGDSRVSDVTRTTATKTRRVNTGARPHLLTR